MHRLCRCVGTCRMGWMYRLAPEQSVCLGGWDGAKDEGDVSEFCRKQQIVHLWRLCLNPFILMQQELCEQVVWCLGKKAARGFLRISVELMGPFLW